ncbi:MAG TPA: hypothetical protein VMX36_01365 [Sedimentisphaerales bacterium]|nr:hypothetical protein [Sedimentisphaerales bacterium]
MKLTEEQISTKCRQFILDSREPGNRSEQKEQAMLNQDFFRGGKRHWTAEEYELYTSKGVSPVTINRCKPVMKGLLGMYLASKQEIGVKARRGGTTTVAQVHKETLKHTQDVSYADYVYCQVFMRGCIDTESYLKLRIDRAMNVNGQPVLEGKSLWDIDVDHNANEYDLNESAAYIVEKDWMDQDIIKALWPDQDKEIGAAVGALDSLDKSAADRLATIATTEGDVDVDDDESEARDPEMLRKYRYKLHRVHWKEIIPALIVSDTQEHTMAIITDEKKVIKLNRKAKKSVRYRISNHAAKMLHETIFLGNHMLEDVTEPLGKGVTDYPIVRYSPIWDDGFACGALEDITSLNKEENIHRTQTIRILNQTANSGFFTGSEGTKAWMDVLKNFGSLPGIVLPKDKFGGSIEKIKPNELPVGHFTIGQQFEQDIKRVSGVDDASQGNETGKADSGKALNLKIQSNRSANEIMFDNLHRTQEIFGNMLLKAQLANDFYTDDEIKLIVSESSMLDSKLLAQARHRFTTQNGGDLPQPKPLPPITPEMAMSIRPEDKVRVMQQVQQGVEAAEQYAKVYPQLAQTFEEVVKADAIKMLLKELRADKGMYGIKVTVSPSSPTERAAQFMQVDAIMTKYGNLIPPEILLDLTDLPQKDEIIAKIKAAQQAQAQAGMGRAA